MNLLIVVESKFFSQQQIIDLVVKIYARKLNEFKFLIIIFKKFVNFREIYFLHVRFLDAFDNVFY